MQSFLRPINRGSYNDVRGDQLNNSHNTTTIVRGNYNTIITHSVYERTEYNEFEYVKLGNVIALRTLFYEDLSECELSYRSGRMIGRFKALVTTCTITLGGDKDSRFTALMYEGEDSQKAWENDFRYVSGIRNPDFPQLFGLNQSRIPMLIFHHDLGYAPVRSLPATNLDSLLTNLTFAFDYLVRRDYSRLYLPFWILVRDKDFPEDMKHLIWQLRLSRRSLNCRSSPQEWDRLVQQLLHLLHIWGFEIDPVPHPRAVRRVRIKNCDSIEELYYNGGSLSETKNTLRTRSGRRQPNQHYMKEYTEPFVHDRRGKAIAQNTRPWIANSAPDWKGCVPSDNEDDLVLYPRLE